MNLWWHSSVTWDHTALSWEDEESFPWFMVITIDIIHHSSWNSFLLCSQGAHSLFSSYPTAGLYSVYLPAFSSSTLPLNSRPPKAWSSLSCSLLPALHFSYRLRIVSSQIQLLSQDFFPEFLTFIFSYSTWPSAVSSCALPLPFPHLPDCCFPSW